MTRLLPIAFRMSRRRFGGLVAVAFAVLFGAMAVTTTGALAETGIHGHAPTGRLGSADLLVAAPQEVVQDEDMDAAIPERVGVPGDLVATLGALPGISHVVGDLSFPATPVVNDTPMRLDGHGWSSAALPDTPQLTGRAPTSANELAVDAVTAESLGVQTGDTLNVIVGGQRADYRVMGIVDGAPPGLYLTDDAATVASARGGEVDLIALWTAPGVTDAQAADQVRAALTGTDIQVTTGAERGDMESLAAGSGRTMLIALSGSLSGVILMIVGFIVTGALAISVAGQRRDLALMRAVGATPLQVRRIATMQGVFAALLALPPGILGGYLLAERAREWFVELGIIPAALPLVVGPLPALATAVLFLAVVSLAARGAAMRVSRLPATEAVAQTSTEPRPVSGVRSTIGFALIGLSFAMAAMPLFARSRASTVGTGTAGIVAVIGLSLAGPAIVRAGAGLLARVLARRNGAPSWLAAHNLHAYASRSAGALTSLAMAITLAVTYVFAQTAAQGGAEQDLVDSDMGAVTVTAPDLGGVPAYALDELREIPGAKVAVHDTSTILWPFTEEGKARVDSYQVTVLGADAEGLLDLDVREGNFADLTGDSVAISRTFALFKGLDVDDKADLVLADGTSVNVAVAAIYARELGYGDLVLSPDLPYSPRHAYGSVLVGNVDPAVIRAALDGVPGVVVAADPPVVKSEITAEMWLNFIVIGGLLGYVLLGVINSMVTATARRREEFGSLRFAGATPGQLRAMIRREALMYGVGACVAGLALSVLPVAFVGIGMLGTPVATGPWWLVGAVCGMVLVIAYAATVVPGRRAVRRG